MKADRYKTIIKILDSLYMEESNLIANLSNTAAVIKEYLGFFWVGFYLVDEESNQLIVGPYQGPLACGRIDYGKGVCGSSWKEAKTLVVKMCMIFQDTFLAPHFLNRKLLFRLLRRGGFWRCLI